MKFIKLILLHIVSLSLINLWALSITSATYNAGTNVMTITFSDSVNTDSVHLDRLSLNDDYGGPNTDVVFTGGTILTENTLSSEIQTSLIYGGIIDQWEGRDIWGNVVSLVNAVEALDLSTLILFVDEGAFIDNNAEPFIDADSNGVYSPAEQFIDMNGNNIWDDAEPFTDLNNNGTWDDAEEFTDLNGNGIWDGAEEFTDCGVNNDGIYICDNDDGWDDSFGNGEWDGVENFEDGYLLFPEDGFWNFDDNERKIKFCLPKMLFMNNFSTSDEKALI